MGILALLPLPPGKLAPHCGAHWHDLTRGLCSFPRAAECSGKRGLFHSALDFEKGRPARWRRDPAPRLSGAGRRQVWADLGQECSQQDWEGERGGQETTEGGGQVRHRAQRGAGDEAASGSAWEPGTSSQSGHLQNGSFNVILLLSQNGSRKRLRNPESDCGPWLSQQNTSPRVPAVCVKTTLPPCEGRMQKRPVCCSAGSDAAGVDSHAPRLPVLPRAQAQEGRSPRSDL